MSYCLIYFYTRWPSTVPSGKPIAWLKFDRFKFTLALFVGSKLFMSCAALSWCADVVETPPLDSVPSGITIDGIGMSIDCIVRSLFTLFNWFCCCCWWCWWRFGSEEACLRMPGGTLFGLELYKLFAPLLTINGGIIFVVWVTSGGGIMLWFIAIKLLLRRFNVLLRDAFIWWWFDMSELTDDMLWGSVADATE